MRNRKPSRSSNCCSNRIIDSQQFFPVFAQARSDQKTASISNLKQLGLGRNVQRRQRSVLSSIYSTTTTTIDASGNPVASGGNGYSVYDSMQPYLKNIDILRCRAAAAINWQTSKPGGLAATDHEPDPRWLRKLRRVRRSGHRSSSGANDPVCSEELIGLPSETVLFYAHSSSLRRTEASSGGVATTRPG
jgi:hypothetical protein